MNLRPAWITIAGIIGGIAIASAWNVWGESEPEREKPESSAPQSAAETAGGLDEAAIRMGGIVAERLKPMSHRRELQAVGVVLSAQELNDLQNSHAAAQAQVEVAQVTADASRKEYERQKALHADNRNVSDKAVQAAESSWRADEARAKAVAQALRTVEQNAKQQWGGTLANAVFHNTSRFKGIAEQKDVLVQVTIAGTYLDSAPRNIRLRLPSTGSVHAQLISPAPRTDPRIQGESLFYAAPAQKHGLVPGMNLSAALPVGPEEPGYLVPETAVVWWQGKAWVYVEEDKGHYEKQALPSAGAVDGGWFVPKEFGEGKPVVVTGAQLLLSNELRPRGSSAGGDGDDD